MIFGKLIHCEIIELFLHGHPRIFPGEGKNRVFHGFVQAKFAYSGLILGSIQFTQLSQLPLKMMLDLKVVKTDSKDNHVASLI